MAPLAERVQAYLDDPAELDRVLAAGAARAREVAGATLEAVYDRMGFLRRGACRSGRGGKICVEAEETSRFEQLRERHDWLDHLVRAGARYTERHGDHYAAAITYFSVLALVPLLMVAFAVAGFVLRAQPELLDAAAGRDHRGRAGALGDTLNDVIDQAIASAGTVGVFGLLGAPTRGSAG